jgi:pimeloyl-ACP methyl ester carboxylesterase
MGTYVELPQVKTWYDERGEGEPLVLMHGGVVDARFFEPNIDALAARFRVFALDLRGHGHTPDVGGPFTYGVLAQDTIDFVDAVVRGPVHVVGHSVGDRLISTDEVDVDQVVAAFGTSCGAVSPDGEDHYPVVVRKVFEMDRREPALSPSDLGGVGARTLVMASDDDIVTLEHTLALYRGIKDSELAVVPGTSHFLTQEKPELCNAIMVDFLATHPVATVAPLRRMPSGSAA